MPAPAPWPAVERWRVPLLLAVTLGAVALRVALVLRSDGLVYPDEVYQSLEPAHRLAFGYGLLPWEFEVGARSWLFAGLLAGAMRAGALFGLAPHDAGRLAVAVASGATAWGCAQVVRALKGGAVAQLLAATAWASLSLAVLLGARGLSESAATLPLVLGLWRVAEEKPTRVRLAVAAALLTVAVMLRPHCAVFALAAPVVWAARKDSARAGFLAGALAAGVVAWGLFDLVTWGRFLHAAREYVRFNLLEGGASTFGTAPPSYYPGRLWTSLGLVLPVAGALALLSARRATALLAAVAVFFALHLATPHKELRFLLPALPLFLALAALGADEVTARGAGWGRVAMAALVGALLLGQPRVPQLTFRALGVPLEPADAPALEDGGPENRLLEAAGRRADVCGVEVKTRHLGYTGGYSWLHRRIPLYAADRPPADARFVNAVVARRGLPLGEVLAQDGDVFLYRLDHDTCEPDASFDWKVR